MKKTLVGHWPLNEDSGSTAYDYSGNENHGTVDNGGNSTVVGVSNGPLGSTAYSFDGTDDYISISPVENLFSDGDPVTLTGWVNKDNTDSNQHIVGIATSRYSIGYEIQDASGFEGSVWNGSDSITVSSGDTTTGSWKFLALTYDSSKMEFYVDGVSQGTASVSSSLNNNESDIGDNGFGNRNFGGDIADVRVYSRALSPQEIQYLYEVSQHARMVSGKKTL